jgi:hypothetical protein
MQDPSLEATSENWAKGYARRALSDLRAHEHFGKITDLTKQNHARLLVASLRRLSGCTSPKKLGSSAEFVGEWTDSQAKKGRTREPQG